MVDIPKTVDAKAHKAFKKVKEDVKDLRSQQMLINEHLSQVDPLALDQMRREITLLRDKQEQDIEKLKSQVAKCTCQENKADINDLRRDIAKINFSSVKDELRFINNLVKEHTKELKSLQTSVDKVLLSDSLSQRIDDLEDDLEERLDTLERTIQKGSTSGYKQIKEDDVIDEFASSYDQDTSKKSFKKWLFSKEEDTDDVDEVK